VYKYFLKPIKIILGVYILGGLSIASDVAQLTSFNFLDFLKKYSPQSLYFLIIGTLLLYFFLVIIEFIRDKPTLQLPAPECNSDQFIRTHNVKNSTIIQIRKYKED
jgi:Ni/Fe-hydrogenase subunit HybB-like protein